MTKSIIITDENTFNRKKQLLVEGGAENLHLLSDFDRTLTYAHVGGVSIPSIISLLRDNGYLSDEYPKKAHELFDYYHAIEKDLSLDRQVRVEAMNTWWRKHFVLLIESGLTKDDIYSAIDLDKIKLRNGVKDLMQISDEKNIPFVIMSSSGLGEYGFSCFFTKNNISQSNIHVVSNRFEWNEEGAMTGVCEPIIHGMNKNEVTLKQFDFYHKIKDRKNVLLLGDSLSDVDMISGFEYDNMITVGFLNEDVENKLEAYKKAFDVVITEDDTIDFVVNLVKEIIK